MSEKRTRSRKQPVHGQMMDKRAVGKAVHVSVKKLTSYMGILAPWNRPTTTSRKRSRNGRGRRSMT